MRRGTFFSSFSEVTTLPLSTTPIFSLFLNLLFASLLSCPVVLLLLFLWDRKLLFSRFATIEWRASSSEARDSANFSTLRLRGGGAIDDRLKPSVAITRNNTQIEIRNGGGSMAVTVSGAGVCWMEMRLCWWTWVKAAVIRMTAEQHRLVF